MGNWFKDNTCRVVGNGRNTFFWMDNWVGGVPLRTRFRRLNDLVVHRECSVADVAELGWEVGGSGWVWRRGILVWEEESMRECSVLLHNVVLQDNIFDYWKWLLEPTQGYSVRGTYHFLTATDDVLDGGRISNMWHKVVPSKIFVFTWRLLRNKIPTKTNLLQRVCVCVTYLTVHGLFCGVTYCQNHMLGIDFVPSGVLFEHFEQVLWMVGMPRSTHSFFRLIWLVCVWVIWKERNDHIFKNVASDPCILSDKVKLNSYLWLKSNLMSFSFCYHDWCRHPLLCMDVTM